MELTLLLSFPTIITLLFLTNVHSKLCPKFSYLFHYHLQFCLLFCLYCLISTSLLSTFYQSCCTYSKRRRGHATSLSYLYCFLLPYCLLLLPPSVQLYGKYVFFYILSFQSIIIFLKTWRSIYFILSNAFSQSTKFRYITLCVSNIRSANIWYQPSGLWFLYFLI